MASKIFDCIILPDPMVALLNIKPETLSRNQHKLFILFMIAAKQVIASAWKSPALLLSEAEKIMNLSFVHAKLEALDKNGLEKFDGIWKPWVIYYTSDTFDSRVLMSWY